MRTRRKGKHTGRKRVFVALLLCSAVGLLLPRSLTSRLMNLVQVFVPLQDTAKRGADALGDAVGGVRNPEVSTAEVERLITENQALQHTVVSQQATIDALGEDVRELTGIRTRGMPGRLIPARVVSQDVLAWRESLLVATGTLSGARRDAAVVSNHFTVNLGAAEGVRIGQAVLAAEVFIGTIDVAGTHTARVKLLSDPTTRMVVWIARDNGSTFDPLQADFWLVGSGGKRARIEDVNHRYVNSGAIAVGDWVLTTHGDERLPVSLAVGTVSAIAPDVHNPLLCVLDVELAIDPDRLRRVYVVDLIGE